MWSSARTRIFAAVAFATLLSIPAYGDAPASNKPGDGLTRDAFADPSAPPHAPAPAPSAPRPRSKRTRLDSKDFLSVHHVHRRAHAKARTQVAVATPHTAKRRGPVVSFVYWWNGLVIKTFHTKVGTVMLGTIGAKS